MIKSEEVKRDNVKKKKKFSWLVTVIYVLTFIIYIAKPICFDVKLYIEAAQRAENLGNFPCNIFEAWEHKYILNRLIFYIIFKIASLVVSANNIMLFELVVKIIYGILAIVIIKCFSKSTKSFFENYKISESTVFGILYFSIIGSNIYFSMQTEMTAFLITLLAIMFILKNKLRYKIISAFLISTLFWFKGITILNSIIVLAVMLLHKQGKKEIIFVISWSWIFLLLELLLINCIEPNEINRMYLATQYLKRDLSASNIIKYFFELLSYVWLWIGLLIFVINCLYHIRSKNIKMLILESFTWTALIGGVFIQGLIYYYQMGLVIGAIIFSTFIFLYYRRNTNKKYERRADILLILIMLLIILSIGLINIINEVVCGIDIYINTIESTKQLKILEEQIPDIKEEKVLYIGNGLSSYYIKAPSYTEYTTTIFLSNNNKVYLNSKYIEKLKNTIKDYRGKYIIIDKIEFTNKYRLSEDIIKFIEENYSYKQNTNISIYEYEPKNDNEYFIVYEKNI